MSDRPDETVEALTIFCESIEDITPTLDPETKEPILEVTMADVDIVGLIQDIGFETLLSHMAEEEVLEYYADKRKLSEEESGHETN